MCHPQSHNQHLPTPSCVDCDDHCNCRPFTSEIFNHGKSSKVRAPLILAIFACLQNALAGGLVFGWASIDRTLLVASAEEGGAALKPLQTTQIFSMASSVAMCSTLIMGFVLDRFGPRACSVISNLLIGTGCHLFSKANTFQTFAVAACCMAFGGPGISYSLVHIANLFPKYQFLVMSILGGSVTLSFSVLAAFGNIWESYHVGFRTLFGGYALVIAGSTVGSFCLWPDAPFENRNDLKIKADETVVDKDDENDDCRPLVLVDADINTTAQLGDSRHDSSTIISSINQTTNENKLNLRDQPFCNQVVSPVYLKNLIIFITNSFFVNFTIASLSTELEDQQTFSIPVQHKLSSNFTGIISCGLVGSVLVGSLMDRFGLEYCTILTLLLGQISLVALIFSHSYIMMLVGFVFYMLYRQFLFPVFIACLTARLGFKYFGMLSGIGFTLSGFAQIWMSYLVNWFQGDCHLLSESEYWMNSYCSHGSWKQFHFGQILLLAILMLIPIRERLKTTSSRSVGVSSSHSTGRKGPALGMSLLHHLDSVDTVTTTETTYGSLDQV